MQRHVVILSTDAYEYGRLIAAHQLDGLTLVPCTDVDRAREIGENAEILFGDPDLLVKVLPSMPNLRWVQSTWAGVSPLLDGLERHYRLTNIKGVFNSLMSEYVVGYLLAHERRIFDHYKAQLNGQWHPVLPGRLKDKVIGFLGLGSIGLHLAATAKHFGMTTFGCSRTEKRDLNLDQWFSPDALVEMVTEVDYLVSSLPSTPHTQTLIDSRVFSAFKPGALLINIGRGDVLDEVELLKALRHNKLGGAVLDVFREEPLPASHPFWQTDNLLITSHTAAPCFLEDIVPIFVENYQRYCRNEPLLYEVDFDQGY